jgi:hypothetical protein
VFEQVFPQDETLTNTHLAPKIIKSVTYGAIVERRLIRELAGVPMNAPWRSTATRAAPMRNG